MTQRAQFTFDSAERIAKVVRAVEGATPGAAPLSSRRVFIAQKPKLFRVATYTGAWSIGSDKTVTFKNQTATVSATNLFFPVTNTASAARDCAIAKDGTAWYLVDVGMRTATAVFVTGTANATFVSGTTTGTSITQTAFRTFLSLTASTTVVTDVTLSASLNTSACTISIGKTLQTASISVVSGTTSVLVVTGTATAMFASGTATAIFVTSTVTATYLQME